MKVSIEHPAYGQILYEEGLWSGKKTLTVNGSAAQAHSKNEFVVDTKKFTVKGSYLTGVHLHIEDESIELSPKPKWYETVVAILPLLFILVWSNNKYLCAIFPVVGGLIGGALGGLGIVTSFLLMKKAKSPMIKVLIGLAVLAATAFVAFLLAIALAGLLFLLTALTQ